MRIDFYVLSDMRILLDLHGERCALRPWRLGDGAALVSIANNRDIWMNLGDDFPYPYTLDDAAEWLAHCQKWPYSERCFAIEVEGHLAGGAEVRIGGAASGHVAQISYWLGRDYWGRGIATEAAGLLTDFAFEQEGVTRCQAHVFGWNRASCRLLEKAGYTLEGRMLNGIIKDGRYTDRLLYGCIREE